MKFTIRMNSISLLVVLLTVAAGSAEDEVARKPKLFFVSTSATTTTLQTLSVCYYTSTSDTTCTIWGLETGQVLGRVNMVSGHVKTQLIAHDKEVYDIAFSKAGGGRDMFASVGADGSVRMFDLRHLEHSTIIYEDPQHTPLLRLAWNKQDPNYLATVAMDACEVIILDVRVPCTPVARLNNHKACVNGIAWAPHSSCHICTAGDDHQALIWDIQQMPRPIEDPILAYNAAEGEINQIQWGATQPDWIAICYNKCLEILRV